MKSQIAFAFLLTALLGCDGGVRSTEQGQFYCSSETFSFPALRIGESAERRVEIYNEGNGPLKLAYFKAEFSAGHTLMAADGPESSKWNVYYDESGEHFPQLLELEPGGTLVLLLSYKAQAQSAQTGQIEFETNDSKARNVKLTVSSHRQGAEIALEPHVITFGQVEGGEQAQEKLTLSNLGQDALQIESVHLNGSQDFSLTLNGQDFLGNEQLWKDPDGDGEPGLAANSSVELEVIYHPEVIGPDEAELSIRSSDAVQREIKVSIVGNSVESCISVRPNPLDFTGAALYSTVTKPVSIESCGLQPLTISRFYIEQAGDQTFWIDIDSPQAPLRLPGRTVGEAAPSESLFVNFVPNRAQAYAGKLVIESDAKLQPRFELPLSGEGLINDCPTARISSNNLQLAPGDFVELDGSRSFDEDGHIVRWEWSLVSHPEESRAQIAERYQNINQPNDSAVPDDPSTPKAKFFVDAPGTYVFELRVSDDLGSGAESGACASSIARLNVEVKPNTEIWVQMLWSTPGDSDETDAYGTDIDLHLKKPGTAWKGDSLSVTDDPAKYSCSAQNRRPDWGEEGAANDPVLDLDDTNGAGPESIYIISPERASDMGGPYQVAAYYYRACADFDCREPYGASNVTIRVFLGGELNTEWQNTLESNHSWWVAGNLYWEGEGGRVESVDRIYSGTPAE